MRIIQDIIREFQLHPVLFDIGAAGSPPSVWSTIASESICVSFDPNSDTLKQEDSGEFFKRAIINKAVSATPLAQVEFHATRHPSCSSTLEPNQSALAEYLFSDFFEVKGVTSVPAITIEQVLAMLTLDRIHWFKVDSQGTDGRLFLSIPAQVRNRVLAVDVEPGLINAYVGEDFFTDVHSMLTNNGFWLSRCRLKGSVRMSREAVKTYLSMPFGAHAEQAAKAIRETPGWVEARYLRSPMALCQGACDAGDLALLWCFAMVDDQPGFALDVAAAYRSAYGDDQRCRMMVDGATGRIQQLVRYETAFGRTLTRMKGSLPPALRSWLKRTLRR